MLRFYGYFKEAVVESRLENSRTRRIILYYYLEDKSIMLVEPKQVNSGQPQGAFLKRHVVLKSDGSGLPFMPEDFGIGIDVAILAKQIRLYDCDEYTRKFYEVRLLNRHFRPAVSVRCSFKSLPFPLTPASLPCAATRENPASRVRAPDGLVRSVSGAHCPPERPRDA